MTLSRWYGTFCDVCGVETDVMPTAADSRDYAKRSGWMVAVPQPGAPRAPRQDFCPEHRPDKNTSNMCGATTGRMVCDLPVGHRGSHSCGHPGGPTGVNSWSRGLGHPGPTQGVPR